MLISIKNGNLLGEVYSYFNQIIERLSNLDTTIIFGSMPYWLVMIYYTIFILLIICLEKKDLSKIGLFASLILLVLIGLYNRQALTFYQQVTFLNVNQGDCLIIQDARNGGVMLIDTGGLTYMDVAEKKIMPYLKYHGIRKIDVVVISHNDNDHCGALDELEQYIQIDKIIDDPYTESVSMGNIYLTNLNKYITKKSDENDKSLVLYGEICGMNFLFTGDASSSVESKIIKNNEGLNVDVLKVGHHGSATSSSKEFIEFISPTYGVISVGKNNTYGHPTSKVLETLEEYEVIIYRTDINGTTRFKGKILDKIYIETAK